MAKKIRKARVTLNGELAFPSEYLAAAEFKSKKEGKVGEPIDVTLTIADIRKEEVQLTEEGKKPRKVSKMVMRFKETTKKLLCNVTNADSISQMYGTRAEAWVGKLVTLYPTTCLAFGEMVECLRIREKAPAPSANGKAGTKPEVPGGSVVDVFQDDGDPLKDGLGDAAEPGVV